MEPQKDTLNQVEAKAASKTFGTPLTKKTDLSNLMGKLMPVSLAQNLVRLGPESGGGYLVPDDLEGIEACFSAGVGQISGFENDCADLGMQIYMADKSVDAPATSHENFHFIQKYIGATTFEDFITMDDWVGSSLKETQSDLLLQIDIEGYEYETFLSMSDALLQRSRIIAVEFHTLSMLWSRPFFKIASRAFEKVLQYHSCVHLHPNNLCGSFALDGLEIPRVMEFTFFRKDRIVESEDPVSFPHPLDFDNIPNTSLPLPNCWYDKDSGQVAEGSFGDPEDWL